MRFHLRRKDGNIIHWLNNNYRTITKILIYVPVIVICPIYFLNSPIYELLSHPTTEIIVTTPKQNQETYNNDSSLGFDNGWIPNSLILEHKEMQINSLSKNIKNTIQSKRYQPSITSYPFTMLQNVSSPLYSNDSDNSSRLNGDVILFWHIPKAAGSTVKQVLTKCFRLIRAHQIQHPPSYNIINGVLNVDTSTLPGIARSKQANLVGSGYVDAIVTSHLHEGSALFTPNNMGRMFSFFRHPVELSQSLFWYLGYAKWENQYREEIKNMTLLEYAQDESGTFRIDNWVTRYLVRNLKGVITEKDLNFAKEILETKCLIGMMDKMEESMDRIIIYYGLDVYHKTKEQKESSSAKQCIKNFNEQKQNTHKHSLVGPESEEWKLLKEKNNYDMKLYNFAQDLWVKQGLMLKSEKFNQGDRIWKYRDRPFVQLKHENIRKGYK